MYNLTDHSLEELSLLNVCVSREITREKSQERAPLQKKLNMLYELQTRVLTSFEIVQTREKTLSN